MRNGKYSKSTGVKSMALLLAMVLLVGCAIGGTLAWLVDKTDEVKNTFTTSNIDIELTETGVPDEDGGMENSYKMVPGWTLSKDPKVTVKAGSEDCYLFIKVDKAGKATIKVNGVDKELKIDDYLAYTLATEVTTNPEWTQLTQDDEAKTPVTGVYYRVVNASTQNQSYNLLLSGSHTFEEVTYSWQNNEVLVKPEVTKEMMEALNANGAVQPSITFTAYASQLWKSNNPGSTATDEQIAAAQFTAAEAWANVNPSNS